MKENAYQINLLSDVEARLRKLIDLHDDNFVQYIQLRKIIIERIAEYQKKLEYADYN